ncbi:MAG: peptidylprolyl isomerase [Deltaproteobacteria bacterium]|nr:peptidylprolyl isomerase [Deltaproteobacteria bacterium]
MSRAILYCSLALSLAVACGKPPPDPLEGLPSADGLEPDPARLPQADQEPDSGEIAADWILVGYLGAYRPGRRTELTREHARLRAERLCELARCRAQDFTELARKFSDDSDTSSEGGRLGVIQPGERHSDLERAVRRLEVGQVSAPVETPRGYAVLMRAEPDEAQVSEIVVTHDAAKRYTPRTPRSRTEAAELAGAIRARLAEDLSAFAREAEAHSDLESHARGGFMPIFRKGSAHAKLEAIVWRLPAPGLSEVIETSTGFHIVARWPVRRIEVREIEIRYAGKGAEEAPRSREQAQALIESIRARAKAGESFAALAMRYSDSTSWESEGGGMRRPFGRGTELFQIEKTAFALEPGELSAVVDTGFSFFLFKRPR